MKKNSEVMSFLWLQQTAVQSSILFLSRTVDTILQTCPVVKKPTQQGEAAWVKEAGGEGKAAGVEEAVDGEVKIWNILLSTLLSYM